MKYSPFRTNAALAATCLILALVSQIRDFGALNLQAQGPSDDLSAKLLARHQRERQTFQFGLIGDTQYNAEQEAKFHNLMDAMNGEQLSFVVHDGDIKDSASACTDELFADRFETYDASMHPFIYTPGDNEWTDCWSEQAGSYDPLERLEAIRELFFANPRESLGKSRMSVTSQIDDPAFSLYRENILWTKGEVVFATVHVVGSNNNQGRTPAMDEEYEARNEANLAWISAAFSLAKKGDFAAVMLIMQSSLRFDLPPEDPQRSGFNDTIALLEEETIAFSRPVVLVHGDAHYFRIDKPLLGTRSERRLENFTRLETFGTDDVHWVRAQVVPDNPNIFVFEQSIVVENLVKH